MLIPGIRTAIRLASPRELINRSPTIHSRARLRPLLWAPIRPRAARLRTRPWWLRSWRHRRSTRSIRLQLHRLATQTRPRHSRSAAFGLGPPAAGSDGYARVLLEASRGAGAGAAHMPGARPG